MCDAPKPGLVPLAKRCYNMPSHDLNAPHSHWRSNNTQSKEAKTDERDAPNNVETSQRAQVQSGPDPKRGPEPDPGGRPTGADGQQSPAMADDRGHGRRAPANDRPGLQRPDVDGRSASHPLHGGHPAGEQSGRQQAQRRHRARSRHTGRDQPGLWHLLDRRLRPGPGQGRAGHPGGPRGGIPDAGGHPGRGAGASPRPSCLWRTSSATYWITASRNRGDNIE
jgi:hypothetical protein